MWRNLHPDWKQRYPYQDAVSRDRDKGGVKTNSKARKGLVGRPQTKMTKQFREKSLTVKVEGSSVAWLEVRPAANPAV